MHDATLEIEIAGVVRGILDGGEIGERAFEVFLPAAADRAVVVDPFRAWIELQRGVEVGESAGNIGVAAKITAVGPAAVVGGIEGDRAIEIDASRGGIAGHELGQAEGGEGARVVRVGVKRLLGGLDRVGIFF